MKKISAFILLVTGLFIGNLNAQQSLWNNLSSRDLVKNQPYRKLNFNKSAYLSLMEGKSSSKAISLPLPDGTFVDFELFESHLLASVLADRFPQIKTYNGVSKDKLYAVKIDFNGNAFHAAIRTPNGMVYIDPDIHEAPSFYKSYFTVDHKNGTVKPSFEEISFETNDHHVDLSKLNDKNLKEQSQIRSGGSLLKYRIAVAADNDYSSFHGGTVEGVLSAIVTTINRVNSVYENDLSITFEIVGENDRLIFLDREDDPFEGMSSNQLLDRIGQVIDDSLGTNSYDIGHLFSISTGGLAELGVVCGDRKAAGTTGIRQPVGDPFDIDFVAHEIGHQFDGRHTFNGSLGACGALGQLSVSTAFEPGSGSTIMGYAGICSDDNLQENTDPFFHSNSLSEIIDFTTNGLGNTCVMITSNGNTPPNVIVDKTPYVIPINTPFKLTGSGSDIDNDELTYSWEQRDLGPTGSPRAPVGTAPLFRSFNPNSNPSRVFPRMSNLLNNTTSFGEVLPSTSRELNFSLVVRDNHTNGGGVNSDNIKINSLSTAGPFKITSQNEENLSYVGGLTQTITWDVAGTDRVPIDVKQVKISLSTDGGASFDQVLVESTENDGIAQIRIPEKPTTQARIMIEAIDNLFFDINDVNFSITQASDPEFSIRINPFPLLVCANDNAEVEIFVEGVGGFNEVVSLSISNLVNPLTGTFDRIERMAGEKSILTLSNINEATDIFSTFSIIASAEGFSDKNIEIPLEIIDNTRFNIETRQPAINGINTSIQPPFAWTEVEVAENYSFQLSTDENFQEILFQRNSLIDNSLNLPFILDEGITYYWRTAFSNQCGTSEFTNANFTTAQFDRTTYLPVDSNPKPIPVTGTSIISSTIIVNDDLFVDDINIENLDITHSWIGDLIIVLQSPAGTRDTLINRICNNVNNVLTNIDDQVLSSEFTCPPVNGETFKPYRPLSVFNGENARGNWLLEISDVSNGDGGSLNGWLLNIGTLARQINLQANPNSQTEITLDWTLLNEISEITGFQIESKSENDAGFSQIASVNGEQSSFTVEGLEVFTKYEFMIRAITNLGFSNYSNNATARTLPPIPPVPINLNATTINEESVNITWEDNSNFEEGFILETSLDGIAWGSPITLAENTTSYLFNEVILGETYFFRVKAFNITGDSDFSEVTSLIVANINDPITELKIYPNPGKERINIEFNRNLEVKQVLIRDISGKVVISQIIPSNETTCEINTTSFNNGIYLISLFTDKKSFTRKWVKR